MVDMEPAISNFRPALASKSESADSRRFVVYRSSAPDRMADRQAVVRFLEKMGVRTMVDFRAPMEKAAINREGFEPRHIHTTIM